MTEPEQKTTTDLLMEEVAKRRKHIDETLRAFWIMPKKELLELFRKEYLEAMNQNEGK